MTTPVMPARHFARRRSILPRVLLAVAILVPVGVLFAQSWQADSDKLAAARAEQHGLEYLTALQPVINAVADAESIAVGRNNVSFNVIDPAVVNASAVDERLGGELRSSVLWNKIRNDIAVLHNFSLTPALAVEQFSGISQTLLDLSDKVRQTSGLIRDPDPDTYFLEDAATHQLPASIIAAGKYGDFIVIGMGSAPASQATDNANIISAHNALITAATNLGNDVQSAVDATASRTLSADLLDKLDKYRVSIDGLAPLSQTPVAGSTSAQDNAQAAADKANVVQAANALNAVMLEGVGSLLQTRVDSINSHRWLVAGTGLAAVVVALLPLLLLAARRTARIGLPAVAERRGDADRPAGHGQPESALRGRLFADGDDGFAVRHGEPLPSRLAAARQWPDLPAERSGWERTGVPR